MTTIYKSMTKKYTDIQIERLTGVCTFVSFDRLMTQSITEAIRLKDTEEIIGLAIDRNGITVRLDTK